MNRPEPYEGMWDFAGSCAPGEVSNMGNNTFSVGVFQWVRKKSGRALKRSAVKWRVKGYVSEPDIVFAKAQAMCDKLNRDGNCT